MNMVMVGGGEERRGGEGVGGGGREIYGRGNRMRIILLVSGICIVMVDREEEESVESERESRADRHGSGMPCVGESRVMVRISSREGVRERMVAISGSGWAEREEGPRKE